MKVITLIGKLLASSLGRLMGLIKMFAAVSWIRMMPRVNMTAVIVEHTHQDISYTNGHITDFTFPEHHYEIKFMGKDSKNMKREMQDWLIKRGGKYDFNSDTRENDRAEVPEEFNCLCSAMETFLTQNSFKKIPVGNKFHVFIR